MATFHSKLHPTVCRWVAAFAVAWGLGSGSPCPADDSWLRRFLPPSVVATPAPDLRLQPFPPAPAPTSDAAQHNRGVELSNEAIDLLKANQAQQALRNLEEAIRCDPGELAFLNNYTLALKQAKAPPARILDAYRRQLGFDPHRDSAALGAGLIVYDSMQDPKGALPYLALAHSLKPQDPQLAVTYANVLNKAGYTDQALDLLNRFAHKITDSAYPMYLLGNLLQDRDNLVAAMRAFEAATRLDNEGYAYDALIRARYFAGQHDGLTDLCRQTLARFPQILNRSSLERILFSLEPHRLRMVEQITLDLTDPSSVVEMELLIRHPPSRAGHQSVRLERAEWLANGSVYPVDPGKTDSSGRESFAVPSHAIGRKTALRLSYLIQVQPWLVARGPFSLQATPNLDQLKADPALDLDDPRLVQLDNILKQLPGHPVQIIFLAVARGLAYKENFQDHPISWIFDNLTACDCTEYAKLLTALLLRRNVPARIPDKGWIPADPTLGNNMYRAYFGNQLSDQVFFDHLEPGRSARISVIQKTSSASDAGLNISSTFNVSVLP